MGDHQAPRSQHICLAIVGNLGAKSAAKCPQFFGVGDSNTILTKLTTAPANSVRPGNCSIRLLTLRQKSSSSERLDVNDAISRSDITSPSTSQCEETHERFAGET